MSFSFFALSGSRIAVNAIARQLLKIGKSHESSVFLVVSFLRGVGSISDPFSLNES